MTATRILILGGGFAGVYTARHLQEIWRRDPSAVEVTLVSRNNYFELTPLLFEAGSGVLDPRHAVVAIRPLFTTVRFIEADVTRIDLETRVVHANLVHREPIEIGFDQLILAMGGVTNTEIIPGATANATTFKTMADAIYLRNRVIELCERADVETDDAKRKSLLTFVIVGGGFVGVELMGELTEFLKSVIRVYPRVKREHIRFEMIEVGPRIAPEFDDDLADYAAQVLRKRGVRIRVNTRAKTIERHRVELDDETIEAHTIIVATGIFPSPLLRDLPIARDPRGRAVVDATMRVSERDDLWALGDCASIPDPQGKPYPPLAQHALREARCLAENISAVLRKQPPKPFVYRSKGSLASLGSFKGVGRVGIFKVKGFLAWWVWRSYYLFQMPGWDRRLRVMIDWTIALFFKSDVVQLNLDREMKSRTNDERK